MRYSTTSLDAGLLNGESAARQFDPGPLANYWIPNLPGYSVSTWAFGQTRNKVVAVGDFNRDGYTDFVLGLEASNPGPTTLTYLRSDGLGGHVVDTTTFASVPMETATGEVGDFNGDGILDIALFDFGHYRSNPGNFLGAPPKLMIGDGAGGFLVSNALEQAVINAPQNTYLGNYSGGNLHVKDIESGDIDNDGDLDFWVESTGGDNIRNHFMINNGDGTFSVDPGRIDRETLSGEPAYTPTGPFWRYGQGELLDIDGDGWLDLVLGQNRDDDFTHETQNSFVVYNDGTGYFPLENRVALPHPDFYSGYTATQGIAATDLNGDGLQDLVLLSTRKNGVTSQPVDLGYQGRYIQVLINNGDRTFRDETAARMGDQSAWSTPTDGNSYNNAEHIRFEDIDRDGDMDLLLGQAQGPIRASGPVVFVNNGSGAFAPMDPRWFTGDSDWWGEDGWTGDFNGDGILDHLHLDGLPGANGNYDGGSFPNDDESMIVLQYGRYLLGANRAVSDTRADGSAGVDALVGGSGRDSLWGLAGADTISGQAGDDSLMGGLGNDVLTGGAGADVLHGGADLDTASYAGSAAGVIVNLATGAASGGDATGDRLASIENLAGSAFNDRLTGSSGANVLSGGAGDDLLIGGLGADALNGGDGSDTASYAGAAARVTIRLFANTAAGGEANGDVLTSIENLIGTTFNDTLSGDAGNNVIEGGAGADTLGGREGFDTLSYASSSARVIINLFNETASGGDAASDIFTGFEAVLGSAYNDVLNGGAGDQTIEGGLGDDNMNGGAGFDTVSFQRAAAAVTVNLASGLSSGGAGLDLVANFERVVGSAFDDTLIGNAVNNVLAGGLGADVLNGGAGLDTADYSASSAAVSVNLAAGTGSGGEAAGDTFVSIENLLGSAFDDTLIGNSSANVLTGGAGADVLNGGGGSDTAVYAASTAAVSINLGAGTASGGHAQGDTFTSIENLLGSDYDDVLIGSAADNILEGGAGADVLDGEGGIDTVSYATSVSRVTVNLTTGTGVGGHAVGDSISDVENVIGSGFADTLYGSAGANRLEGGLGSDALYGRNGDDVLVGGLGNDALYGGNGIDTFLFHGSGLGADRVQDFSTASGDVIELDSSIFTDFADAMSATTDVVGSAVITRGGTTITITGVLKAQLSAGDFQFSSPAPTLTETKDGALTLPPVFDDLDPLILPAGLEGKQAADDLPVICPPGDVERVLLDDPVPPTSDPTLLELAEQSFITRLLMTAYPERSEWTDWVV